MPDKTSFSSIYRSEDNKIMGGVCGGLGEYFNLDPNVIRVIFVLLAVFGGSGFLIYIILWIMLPSKSQANLGKNHLKENLREMKEKVSQFAHDFKNSAKSDNKQDSKNLFAFIAILLGIIFLLQNFGFGDLFNLSRLWPVILIALGISFMFKR